MNDDTRAKLEAKGYKFGDFADFLGMDEAEAAMVAYRADLGSAIRRMRTTAGLTQTAFGKRVGLTQSKVARVEIGAPEVSLDLMMRAYIAAGGRPAFVESLVQSAPETAVVT